MVCTTIGKRANFEKSAKFKVMAAPFPQFEGKELKVPAGGNFLMLFSKDADKQKQHGNSLNISNLLKRWLNGALVQVIYLRVKA